MKRYYEPSRELPTFETVDVLVVGGGPGGIGAAVGAAQQGVSVAVIERFGALGGMASQGYVNSSEGGVAISGNYILIEGVWEQMVESMSSMGGCIRGHDLIHANKFYPYDTSRPQKDLQITVFDAEAFKVSADRLMQKYGVKVWLYTLFCDTIISDGVVVGVVVENRNGRGVIWAERVVDATGDATVCRKAGVECTSVTGDIGQMTLEFHMGGVKSVTQSFEDGLSFMPNQNINFFPLIREGEVRVEMTRWDGDSQDAKDLSTALIVCRQQAQEILRWLKSNRSGFENAYLINTASLLGTLVYPRIIGEYSMTQEDILGAYVPDSRIAITAFGIDIPDPEDHSKFILAYLNPGEYYGIPYEALVPKTPIENLLIGCRATSCDDDAASATICCAISMAVGEAAGTASALSIKEKTIPRNLDVKKIQKALVDKGALLEPKILNI